MPIPRYSTENYRDALLNLLPLGPIWNRARDGAFAALFTVLGAVYQRNNTQAADLIGDIFPGRTFSFLTEWENTLGLPDICSGQLPTIAQRQDAIVAKLTDEGGSSQLYYRRLAAAIGVTISIEQFAPFRAGVGRAGQAVRGEGWAFAWQVISSSDSHGDFLAGRNCAGEPLANWGNKLLRCSIFQRAPAHTIPLLSYLPNSTFIRKTDFGGDIL